MRTTDILGPISPNSGANARGCNYLELVSFRYPRQGCSNALWEIGCSLGSVRGLVDQGAPPEFTEWQRCVEPARFVEVRIDQAVEVMADVDPAAPTGGVRIAYNVNRAAVGQQVVELGLVGEFVDSLQIDQEQSARVVGRHVEMIEVHRLPPMLGADPDDVALLSYQVDQFELLEE